MGFAQRASSVVRVDEARVALILSFHIGSCHGHEGVVSRWVRRQASHSVDSVLVLAHAAVLAFRHRLSDRRFMLDCQL